MTSEQDLNKVRDRGSNTPDTEENGVQVLGEDALSASEEQQGGQRARGQQGEMD